MKTSTFVSLTLSFLLGITSSSAYTCSPITTLDLCSVKEKEINFDIDGLYVNCPGKYTLVCNPPNQSGVVCFSKDPKWRIHSGNGNGCGLTYGLIGSFGNKAKAENRKKELEELNYNCAVVEQQKSTCLNSKPPKDKIILKTRYYNQCDNMSDTYYEECSLCLYGCLVTSVTMMYNQVHGTNYNPITFASHEMDFNDYCGAKYNGYGTGVTSSSIGLQKSEALDIIMYNLKRGHIAVIGGDGYLSNGKGTSHFVAVNGYDGNYKKPYNPKDFLMYDPGNRDKKTLDQFFSYITYNYQTLTI